MGSLPSQGDGFNPAEVLAGRLPMPKGSFLHHLPCAIWPLLVQAWGPDVCDFRAGEKLPVGQDDRDCFIVLGGCVVQKRHPMGRSRDLIARFRGVGQFLGEAKLIEPWSQVETCCLSTTWVLPCSAQRVNVLLKQHPAMQLALLRSLEDRNRADEKVYSMTRRSTLARVTTLLVHLAHTAGTRDPVDPDRITIKGLRQRDISDALALSTSTVENALRHLRTAERAVESGYRELVVADLNVLERLDVTT
ncbi:Crp/Fnr family transcriptional regulator [Streptomyces sp. CMB-StM0423]|uniref:Crp/Fnr family transcriptional regulator n=1 Tax=Streptomyces sp. CMB-StM0423 TaxID=2059884 RepID=UPI000C700A6D|nr:Crp/Fnr family transcriptional regulator [Streptomyces sp. CMB-StM0423]AUH41713.1 Crp/Fnr family transcriptional regulator [Streptomyces sp. CMB-StM0423]